MGANETAGIMLRLLAFRDNRGRGLAALKLHAEIGGIHGEVGAGGLNWRALERFPTVKEKRHKEMDIKSVKICRIRKRSIPK